VIRALLLKASDNRWLREHGVRAPFVRRAVSRFMPGETFDDMLRAANELAPQRIDSVFTRLGENVTDLAEANRVAEHYLQGIDRIKQLGLDCEPSIKLTQLGLDINRDTATAHARAIAGRAHAASSYLWIDMEQSPYVDVTLAITEQLRREFPGVGVCLQAYLHRTKDDLTRMLSLGAGVRLVKGAYREPPAIAFPQKSDVDANYLALAKMMIDARAHASAPALSERQRVEGRAVFGTHDTRLIATIASHARATGVKAGGYEFHLLYGIQRAEQARLASAGERCRVLIAYGTYWFPWYVRRLAERPANLWFVAKNIVK
jgi:proline dehydrogenase